MKGIKNIKVKIASIFMLIALMSLQLTPFTLLATATQLQFYSPGLITPATDVAYGKNVFFTNATLGGDTAYCVDYGRSLPTGTMTYYKQLSAQGVSILVYGYPNTSPAEMGCASADEAYMATQLAFWTVLQKTGESEGPRTFNLDNIYAKPGYEEFMQRAAAAARRLNARALADPYIPNPELNVDSSSAKLVNSNGEIITGPYVLNVTGGTVSSIKVSLSGAPTSARTTDGNGNSKSTFSNGEAVYVRFNQNETGSTMRLNVEADTNKVVGSIYTSGNSSVQNFVKLDTVPVELSTYVDIRWGTQTGAIEIYKVDQDDNEVEGVTFELRNEDGETLAEGTTGSNGYIKFSNVQPGRYELVEVDAPSEYEMREDPIEVTVEANQTIRKTIENKRKEVEGSLEIKKVDEEGKAIPNVTFEILDEDRNKIGEITTDENGRAKISNLEVGTYYYREIKAPVNVIVDKTVKEFKITKSNRNVVEEVVNEKVKGSLQIIKVDESNEPIAGVKFDILDSNKKVIETITTNASGVAVSKDLPIGTYYYKEVEAPSNVVMDTNEYEFKIESTGQIITKTVVNKVAKGKLEIHKVDNTNTPIAGVKFNILDSNKNVVDTIVTNASGVAVSKDLPIGTYYYKEVEAPSNVVMDTNEYEFKLTSNEQVLVKTVINDLQKGSIQIFKIDSERTPIPGVTFQILDSNKNVIDTIITDENGKASSKELEPGTYYYKEFKAPANVVLDDQEYEFRISGTTIVEKTVVNQIAKGKIKIVKVDNTSTPIAGVKFDILDSNKNVVDTIVTDENGIAISDNLKLGTYYYKEVEAPSDVIMDTNEYTFKLSYNTQVIEKRVINQKVKGAIEIYKYDENATPIAGVKFDILDSNKKVVDTIVTDENGKAVSSMLEVGTYYYKEVEAPSNVIMDSTEHAFIITETNVVVKKTVVNQLAKGNLKIIKVDENATPIAGVTFEILDSNKTVVDTIITDENGIATSKDLPLGTYYYKEVKAPSNVIIDSTEYSFILSEDNQVIQKTVVNRLVAGNLKVVKVDEKNVPIAGVTFNILDVDKKVIDTIVTDENGTAMSKDLAIGTYYYKEVKVPDGYILDTTEYKFKITEVSSLIQKKVVNKTTKVSITKTDITGDKELPGATLQILDKNGNIIEEWVSGTEAHVIEGKLIAGEEYTLRETIAPDGYAYAEDIVFTVDKTGNVTQVVMKDDVTKVSITKTDITGDEELPGATLQILDKNGNVIEEWVSGTEAHVIEGKLIAGEEYTLRETIAPDGYAYAEDIVFTVDRTGKVTQVVMKDDILRGEVEIPVVKVWEDYDNQYQTRPEKITVQVKVGDEVVAEHDITEQDDWKYTFTNLPKYDENGKEIVYTIDEKDLGNIQYEKSIQGNTITNKLLIGALKIIKVDENNIPLAGVEFEILDSNKKVVDTIVTDEEGIAISRELAIGKTYYFKETKVPEGIILDSTEHKFVLNEVTDIVVKKIVNYYQKGNIQIVKVDTEDQPIEGVVFHILDENGKVVDSITSDENGIATSKKLPLGTYYYQEISAPENYVVDTTIHKFKLTENEQTIVKKVVNIEKYGSLQILKLDKKSNAPIANVQFNIMDVNGNILDTVTTDENGIAVSKNLPMGTYYYQEISAPNGYIMDKNVYDFTLETHEQIVNVTVYNEKEELPVTGGVISLDFMIIICVSIISILGYMMNGILSERKKN